MKDGIQDFASTLKMLIQKRGGSVKQTASLLGYASKTSLDRILKRQTTFAPQQDCYQRLLERGNLEPDELAALCAALEVSRVGVEKAKARQVLEDMICKPFALSDALSPKLGEFVKALDAAESADILAVNSLFPALFSGLRPILARHSHFSVAHFFALGPSEVDAASALSCISLMAHLPNYEACLLKENRSDRLLFGMNLLCVRMRDAAGRTMDALVQFSEDGGAGILQVPDHCGLFAFYQAMFEAERENCERVSASCDVSEGPAGFIDVMNYWADRESDHDMYAVKSDLCANLIAPEIIRAALMEGGITSAFPMVSQAEIARLLEVFLDGQGRRYENMRSNRRVKNVIMSQAAVRRFARTGLITEHFAFMRPFTVPERISMLEYLLRQNRYNQYLTVYFWAESDFQPVMEVDCWDGYGITAFPSVKESAMQENYCNSVILHPRLIAVFKEYFMDDLLRSHTLSEKRGAQFLEELIGMLNRTRTQD